ncbi:MAG: hypothetical protein HFG54_10890 [Lachnospiraceae bacterium]|nr:hypothetical protein [Lachnospiraceae bacterium]
MATTEQRLQEMMAQKRRKEQERKEVTFDAFRDNFKYVVESDTFDYKVFQQLCICPEPYGFIKEFDEYENNRGKCQSIFNKMLSDDGFLKIEKKDYSEEAVWTLSSNNGLGLRIGLRDYNRDQMEPLQLDEDKSGHAILVGKAGAGKSELLWGIVLNAMREYSPYELQLYLANFQAEEREEEKLRPHVHLLEDYNEVKNILDLLTYAETCMRERIRLFDRMGIEMLSELKDKVHSDFGKLVLPRKLIIIDRVYSIYKEASDKEVGNLNRLIGNIIEDGARSGIHLLLSAREPSTRMNEDIIAKCNNWIVMKSKAELSKKLLEDDRAVDLEAGELWLRQKEHRDGSEKYKAPLIGIDDPEKLLGQADWILNFGSYPNQVCDSGDIYGDLLREIQNGKQGIERLGHISMSYEEIAQFNEFIEKRNNTLAYDDFKKGFVRVLQQNRKRFAKELPPGDIFEKEIVRCREPLEFLKEYSERFITEQKRIQNNGDNQKSSQEIYWDILKQDMDEDRTRFERIYFKKPEEFMWFNTTAKGINLRPGLLNYNRNNPIAVPMGDAHVHGMIVGRTGAGKSVFINNLIFNLLLEYAPWELDLYLVDFKMVELSRYMTKGFTPHVNACAATSEVRYVVSMIQYLVDCMKARQNFFKCLGVKSVKEFRETVKKRLGYEIVMPRVLLLVDEFQQMFLESTSRESEQISDMLTAITKLGRATGYHLLFASQEMSQTLSGNVFANFKLRFALTCEKEISTTVLGNSAAADIKIGEVLLNTESGAEEDNRKFKVPFIDDGNEEYFDGFLRKLQEMAADWKYEKTGKFYEEDRQDSIEEFENILSGMQIIKDRKLENGGGRYFDIVVLGNPVVYNNKKRDLETFFIEKGVNKNIMVLSPNVDDLVYVQKLLALNFSYSFYQHQQVYVSLNPIIRNKYEIEEDLQEVSVLNSAEELEDINLLFQDRKNIAEAIKKSGSEEEYLQNLVDLEIINISVDEIKEILGTELICEDIFEITEFMDNDRLAYLLRCYYNARMKGMSEIFKSTVVWISGCESVGSALDYDLLRSGLEYNILLVFFATSIDDMDISLRLSNEYIFMGGNFPDFYDKFEIPYTKKDMDSIVIDFKIKSLNTVRSFKKCSVLFKESEAPCITDQELESLCF